MGNDFSFSKLIQEMEKNVLLNEENNVVLVYLHFGWSNWTATNGGK